MKANFSIPYPKGISVNHCYVKSNSGVFLDYRVRNYRSAVKLLCLELESFGDMEIVVEIDMYPPDKRKRDVDNILKTVLDALQHSGMYNDDSQIRKLVVEKKEKIDGGRLDIKIRSS